MLPGLPRVGSAFKRHSSLCWRFEGKGACAGKNSLIFLDFLLNFDILGDSGGSLFIKKDKKYLAAGIISTSLRAPGGFCDTNRHQIFTEVAAYHKWLMDVAIGSY